MKVPRNVDRVWRAAGLPTVDPDAPVLFDWDREVFGAFTAGAVVFGKTNLDQFATGLVGARSPFGAPGCVFNRDYISGGSSSGSGVKALFVFHMPTLWSIRSCQKLDLYRLGSPGGR